MKRLSFIAIICMALFSLTSCGFDEKTAEELTDKFQDDPESLNNKDWENAFDLAIKAANHLVDGLDDILDMDKDDRADAYEELLNSPEHAYLFKFQVMCCYAISQDKVKGDLKAQLKEYKKLLKECKKKGEKIKGKLNDKELDSISKSLKSLPKEFNNWSKKIKFEKDFDYSKLLQAAKDNGLIDENVSSDDFGAYFDDEDDDYYSNFAVDSEATVPYYDNYAVEEVPAMNFDDALAE